MSPPTARPTSPHKKFNTVSANATMGNGGGLSARASLKGLFESGRSAASQAMSKDDGDTGNSYAPNKRQQMLGADAAASVAREDGPWSVSVAALPPTEKRDLLRKKSRQAGVQQYTLYVTTPTHNLTLTRSAVELLELDNRLREGRHDPSNSLPTLPNLPQPSSATITSRSKLLQTISRTLSPNGHKNRASASNQQLSTVGTALSDSTNASNTPVSNSNSASTGNDLGKASSLVSTPLASAPISPSSETPPSLNNAKQHSTTTNLATYLTTAANLAFVKRHKAWKRFISVGSDDLQSVRVERRIRKIRSDLAKHVKSAVAPANTNVAATPSHSDIGEEGGRTDDDRSFSGRSTSHSFRNDRQDVSARSASSDNDRAVREEARKGNNFAGIPEETERQASLEGQGEVASGDATKAASSSRSPNTPQEKTIKRERRHRRRTDEKVTVDDFDMIRVLGKGCAGKVLLVRHKPTKGLFAMKSIHKRHVLAHQELQHTLTEQAVLKRMAKEVMDPFVVKLWWSFHDVNNLYLVMDFHPGGDLATQLSRWGRLGRDRARFYAAEIVEGVEGLHRAGVIYRDLKPENVLIGVDGHIVLSDFGLSKEFPVRSIGDISNGGSSTPPPTSQGTGSGGKGGRGSHWMTSSDDTRSAGSPNSSTDAFSTSGRSKSRWADERDVTTTFCGTAEYLAPEVIQGSAYSYEVDWWSFGTMLYEMLTGITPFWADTHADMNVRVLHDDLVFPDDRVLDQDTKSILRGLLQRNPMLRMKEPRIKKHPYFSMIEWDHVFHKRYIPPYIPPINPLDETDTQNFDETFLDMKPVVNGGDDEDDDEEGAENIVGGNAEGAESKSSRSAKDESKPENGKDGDVSAMISKSASDGKSLFDGYSFRGRKDSDSVRSSIFSSEPSEPLQHETGRSDTAQRQRADSEDDNAAAMAAVAALDHLEREAAASEAAMSSPSQMSTSTHPTSIKGSDDLVKAVPDTPTKSTNRGGNLTSLLARPSSTAGQPATIAEADREDEDEDWDMVDAPAADESYPTEANGGKGQNLFARGVVDTYRLLRRQESSRLPLGASYSGRTLNRLSRRQQSSPRDRSKAGRETNQTTEGTMGNRSVASLGSRSGNDNKTQTTGDEESNVSLAQSTMNSNPSLSAGGGGNGLTTNLTPLEEARRKGASPSLASSDEQTSNEKVNKQRIKKMKRFTNFFETSR
jgi:serine/threonine protein kinase